MAYADYEALPAYTGRVSGSHIGVAIHEVDSSGKLNGDPVIGGTSGINKRGDFEIIPIEEAGNEGVDEIVQGRHSGSVNVQGFWSSERNDKLPTRQSFIGKEYVIFEFIADERPGAGTIVNAYLGCRNNSYGSSHGARGPKTIDLGFAYERRYSGKEWADLNGL